jgi:hypothetical protein
MVEALIRMKDALPPMVDAPIRNENALPPNEKARPPIEGACIPIGEALLPPNPRFSQPLLRHPPALHRRRGDRHGHPRPLSAGALDAHVASVLVHDLADDR